MKCQNLFSEKNKKNISKCHLLKILLRVLRVNFLYYLQYLVETSQIYTRINVSYLLPKYMYNVSF